MKIWPAFFTLSLNVIGCQRSKPILYLFCLALSWSEGGFAQSSAPSENPLPTHANSSSSKHLQSHAAKPAQHGEHVSTKSSAPSSTPEQAVSELSPELMAISELVHSGRMPCELGQSVTLYPMPNAPGQFVLLFKNDRYALLPTISQTGAIRLEDAKQGAVWIQLANKSMLFNTRLGQRMVDECKSKVQEQVALQQLNSPPEQLLSADSDTDGQR